MKPTLYYISDALCGWCFAMGPQVVQLQETYGDRFHFEVLSGGMMTGDRVGPISQMADYIKQVLPRLTEITGVTMGEAYVKGILGEGTYVSNSVPPAVALAIFKEVKPEEQVKYAKAIQDLHFKEGQDLNLVETYLPLAREAGLSEEQFRERFTDDQYRLLAQQEFAQVQAWGIEGFPAMIAQKGEELFLVARGFSKAEDVAEILEKIYS
ncbi:hypothetical protein TH63_16700 [Rufibacter radiotolerans]|uniref:DSBA-like thioredoxin domain-containing protein n=1 Tax=Rufibacter radiotolerans TaxID=1379910 RepID=A0A0H4VM37_9BACT|nr:DsbA family protein [Rufibacter radiotolerans]AKQ46900.1 hypothetical protein TH63_16700 [Rufibacter radiotolerans]